ncbi:MAG: phosphotransferase [Deltaproteobacteria bacterium]|nr:phosphotransferase [Deltaproteobacteria bacterium]
MNLHSELNNDALTQTIRRLMESHYDFGKLTRVEGITGGYCNKSYAVWMADAPRNRRLFLRLYNPHVAEKEIRFEHALVDHLRSNGFTKAAAVVPGSSGETLVRTPPPENHNGARALWALFEFLDGEDKYSWTHTDLTDREFASAARVLAHLHHCGHGFTPPPGAKRVQPKIMTFLPTFETSWSTFYRRREERRCDRLFEQNFETILTTVRHLVELESAFQGMVELPVHCDYHPGNLKYHDEKVIGIFDFDWSKIDYRLFDIALGLVYFTSIWDQQVVALRQDKFSLFLQTYNQACRQFSHVNPLTAQEKKYLTAMLAIANLYVLNWDLVDFYNAAEPDDDEYYAFIYHNIGLMHWLTGNQREIDRSIVRTLG